ncbi:hypothetical protein HGD85_02830 [Rhodobacteraceae bacterium R_SAG10]|jgi:hypothetical protein|nr:hypothetical protein [Rhodobacteraceae bacterium R_SAG10]
MSRTNNDQNPPGNAQRIWRVADLPQNRKPAQFEVANQDSNASVVTLDKRQRQAVELLMTAPVFCSSPVRIGDTVHILKREIGLKVETRFYLGDRMTGAGDYGVYFLVSQVRHLPEMGMAA